MILENKKTTIAYRCPACGSGGDERGGYLPFVGRYGKVEMYL